MAAYFYQEKVMSKRSFKNITRLIDMAKDEMPVQEAFLGDLKRSIEKEEEATRRKPSQYYKPSSMNCIRNMYYQRVGKEPDTGTSSYIGIGICNAGTDIHVRTQTAVAHMKKYGFDCHYIDVAKFIKKRGLTDIEIIEKKGMETKLFNKRLNLSFLCDGIVKYQGKYYILEIKSESSFKFQVRTAPAEEHHRQVTSYSISLGLDDVLFVYINRDNLDMKSYLFKPTSDMKNDLVGLIDNCEGYVSRMITPPKPEDISRKTCEYCNYRSLCRKEK